MRSALLNFAQISLCHFFVIVLHQKRFIPRPTGRSDVFALQFMICKKFQLWHNSLENLPETSAFCDVAADMLMEIIFSSDAHQHQSFCHYVSMKLKLVTIQRACSLQQKFNGNEA